MAGMPGSSACSSLRRSALSPARSVGMPRRMVTGIEVIKNILMTKSFCLFIVLSQALLSSNMGYAVEIIGHRGASFDAPENTLSSFKLGYQQKADADEL